MLEQIFTSDDGCRENGSRRYIQAQVPHLGHNGRTRLAGSVSDEAVRDVFVTQAGESLRNAGNEILRFCHGTVDVD
jgi:hypothetical protein